MESSVLAYSDDVPGLLLPRNHEPSDGRFVYSRTFLCLC